MKEQTLTTNGIVKGVIYLPEDTDLNLQEKIGVVSYSFLSYNKVDEEKAGLNFKFLKKVLDHPISEDADFILGFGHDLNAIVIACKNELGVFQLLNPHQAAVLFTDFFVTRFQEEGAPLHPKEVVKSELLTEQIENIVLKNESKLSRCLPIEDVLRKLVLNGETVGLDEKGHVILHPDILVNAEKIIQMVSDMFKSLQELNLTLFERYLALSNKYGFYVEKSFLINRPNGVKKLFDSLRLRPPAQIVNSDLKVISDYKKGTYINKETDKKGELSFPAMDLVMLETIDGLRIFLEPSDGYLSLRIHLSQKSSIRNLDNYRVEKKQISDFLIKVIVFLGKFENE